MKGCYSSFVKINEGHNGLPMDKTKLDLSVSSSKTSWKYVWRPILRPNPVPKGMCPHCSSPEHSDYNHKHQIYCLLCKQTGHSQSLCHSRKAEVGFQIKSPIYDSFDKKYKGISWASPPSSWFRMESGSLRSGPSNLTRFSSFMEVRKAVFSTNSSLTVSVVETALLHKTPLVVAGDTLLHTSAINNLAQLEIIATSVPSSPTSLEMAYHKVDPSPFSPRSSWLHRLFIEKSWYV